MRTQKTKKRKKERRKAKWERKLSKVQRFVQHLIYILGSTLWYNLDTDRKLASLTGFCQSRFITTVNKKKIGKRKKKKERRRDEKESQVNTVRHYKRNISSLISRVLFLWNSLRYKKNACLYNRLLLVKIYSIGSTFWLPLLPLRAS